MTPSLRLEPPPCLHQRLFLHGAALVGAALLAGSAAAQAVVQPLPLPGLAFDVQRIELELDLDMAARQVTGHQRLVIAVDAGNEGLLRFSGNALVIESIARDDRPLAFDASPEAIEIALPERGHNTTLVLEIGYHGTPARGLSFHESGVYTSYHACDWMVCRQDEPGDGASFSLSLTMPASFLASATGVQRSETVSQGRRTVAWEEARALPAFGYGFAAGEFHTVQWEHRGVELVAVSPVVSAEELAALLADTGGMLDFLEDRAGLAFAFKRYVQVVVPGYAAQEASGMAILGAETLRPILTEPSEDWAIVHELAHQWWGLPIVPDSWAELWLSEGLTSFMVAAYKEQRWGREHYDREIELATGRWAYAREQDWDVPLAFAGDHPSLRLRRAIAYSKGLIFLDLLRQTLGEVPFWAGVRLYTQENFGSSVTSADLQRALEDASGRDLSSLFDAWVYPQPGP